MQQSASQLDKMAKFLSDVGNIVKDIEVGQDPTIAKVAERLLSFMKEGYEGEFFRCFTTKGWPKSETPKMIDTWRANLVVTEQYGVCGFLHEMENASRDLVLSYHRMAVVKKEPLTVQRDHALWEVEAAREALANHIQKSQEQLAQEHSQVTSLEETMAKHVQELDDSSKQKAELAAKVAELEANLAHGEEQLRGHGEELQKARAKVVEAAHMVKMVRE